MPDELVFNVQESHAVPATPISLSEAGLVERQHLQEWVLAHPEIIGDGVLVVSSEFDSWRSTAGIERDRLDVLGLDRSGRLVVAELKRDRAPDTVEMQAIKYAAMASRFTPDVVASQYAEFLKRRGTTGSDEDAMARLTEHVGGELDPDLLRQPRTVLVASAFPPTVTATTVWLTEMGLDISLVRVQAYRAQAEQVIVSVSQLYPVPDVEEFTVAPVRARARRARSDDYPELPWDADDLQRFADVITNPTVRAAMDLCSSRPGEWISIRAVETTAGRTPGQARADLAGLTMMVKRRFARSNWPFSVERAAGGEENMYYRMDNSTAQVWTKITAGEVGQTTLADGSANGPT
jgi:Endonuclease NucS